MSRSIKKRGSLQGILEYIISRKNPMAYTQFAQYTWLWTLRYA